MLDKFTPGGLNVCPDVHDEAMEKKSPREDDPLGPKCYYNKAKSFYDNISSDYKLR